MRMFSRAYVYFYNELGMAFKNLIDEYANGEKTLDVKTIIEAYDACDLNVDAISYKFTGEGEPEGAFSVFITTDGISKNINTFEVVYLITIYEMLMIFLLCIEYGIELKDICDNMQMKNKLHNAIIQMFDNEINDVISAEIPLMKESGICDNRSALDYYIQYLALKQNKEIAIETDHDEINDKLVVDLSLRKIDGKYVFNLKHEMFGIDINEKNLSEYEILSLFDVIVKNKNKKYKSSFQLTRSHPNQQNDKLYQEIKRM